MDTNDHSLRIQSLRMFGTCHRVLDERLQHSVKAHDNLTRPISDNTIFDMMRIARRWIAATVFLLLFGGVSHAQHHRAPQDATAHLHTYTSKHFVLKSNCAPKFARELSIKLDLYYEQLQHLLPAILGEPLQSVHASVILFEQQDDYQKFANKNAPQLVNNGGYYDGATRTIVTYRYNNSVQLYFHEILHAVLGQMFKDHYFFRYSKKNWPIWFDEGIAEYFGSFETIDGALRFGSRNKTKIAYLINALATDTLVDLPQLLKAQADRYSGSTMNLYYAEAWGLMDFLIHHKKHRKSLPNFFLDIKNGTDGIKAFKKHFSNDLTDLNRRWRTHLWSLGTVANGWKDLFDGRSIDNWTIHEGGLWTVRDGQINGTGNDSYNYLIRSELPRKSFMLSLEMKLLQGTAGIILGNNDHLEYPYYYLIDIAKNQATLRRAHSATQIRTLRNVQPHIPIDTWIPVSVRVANGRLQIWINGQPVMDEAENKDLYSLFGVYLYRGRAQFRNLRLRKESPVHPAAPGTSKR